MRGDGSVHSDKPDWTSGHGSDDFNYLLAHFQGFSDYSGLLTSSAGSSLETVAVVRNTIGSGAGSHHRAIYPVGARWFMIGNQYRGWPDSSVVVTNVLLEPLAQSVHFQP